MFDNDYVSFSKGYQLNEDLDYDARDLFDDISVDFTGNTLVTPANYAYSLGTDQVGSIAGEYEHYRDNLNTSPRFSATGKQTLMDKYHLPGDPKFNIPNNDYRYQAYNAKYPQQQQYTYNGEPTNIGKIYDLGNRYASDEITSYKFPKHDYSDNVYYPNINKQNKKYYDADRNVLGSYQNRVLNKTVNYDLDGYPIKNKFQNNNLYNDKYSKNKYFMSNSKFGMSNNSNNMENNLPRAKMVRNNNSGSTRNLNIVDSGRNNYSKILQINNKDEASMTKWEGEYFEESRDMDNYNKDATFREYGYTQDNDNTEYDFGDRDIDYSDFREYSEYDVTNGISKNKSNTKGEAQNIVSKSKFKTKRQMMNEYLPSDDAIDGSALINKSTNGFGKPFKSKYKNDIIEKVETSSKLLGSIRGRLSTITAKVNKAKQKIGTMKESIAKKHTELHENYGRIITAMKKHIGKLSQQPESDETDSQLNSLDTASNKLIESVAVSKNNIGKAFDLIRDALEILKSDGIAHEVQLVNEFIESTTDLAKEATSLIIIMKLFMFLIFVIIMAYLIKRFVNYIYGNENVVGSSTEPNPDWLHSQ